MNTPGQAILELLSDGGTRLGHSIAQYLELSPTQWRDVASRLARNGYIRRFADCCTITPDGLRRLRTGRKGIHAASHRTSLRARAWMIMRLKTWFSVPDLLLAVADGTEVDAVRGLRRYVHVLARTGYLIEKRQTPGRWHLIRNTGRLAPAYNAAARTVTDPNTGEVFDV